MDATNRVKLYHESSERPNVRLNVVNGSIGQKHFEAYFRHWTVFPNAMPVEVGKLVELSNPLY